MNPKRSCAVLWSAWFDEFMTTQQLIDQLITDGGAIVCTGDCTDTEIAVAQSVGRFAANADGIGFVRRPKEWVAINKRREELHPNTAGRYSSNSVLDDD